ncbi:hypothetical protein PV371_04075 [Streptomyces sp. TX20-6-3]|uniref:hypothetical protein n=1 Tax=Streptomyces sp. TX20-6-3 TaxID=3028705 RepID=UPI0029AAA98D|nr:hypothetical protein [Streptomyces sp. TX20-6-3]MDX2558826.1 hypothetical protein [Streptomyces sp. TX20-6-3]
MPDTVDTAATLLAAAAQEGPGDTLRIVLLVSIVGGALLAWFLLRGYRTDDSDDTGTGDGAGVGTDGGRGGNTDRDASA